MSLQLCFVKGAVYPVIGRGGRQVRPRLIFKVNRKRVNMFKYILAKISKFFFRRLKSVRQSDLEIDEVIVKSKDYKFIKTSHGFVTIDNDSTKSVLVTFHG